MALQDLADARIPTALDTDPDGWAELMTLASTFPLERLSFGTATPASTVVLPKPREVRYDAVIDIADGAGLCLAAW